MTRWAKRLAALIAAPFLLYALAALVLGLWGVEGRRADPAAPETVTVWMLDNGVHLDWILPMRAGGVDWSQTLEPEHFPLIDFSSVSALALGWGDRGFYLNTPTWGDLKLSTAWRALTGQGGTVLRVIALGGIPSNARPIPLTPEQYRRLSAHVAASFQRDAAGRVQAIPGARYGVADAFFEATGRYSPIDTCNEWVAAGLRAAQAPAPSWSPFPWAVWRFVP